MMHRNATNIVRRPSLIDTVGSGFRALNRVLPVLLVPLALDLWYWLGPRISLSPLVAWFRALSPESWDVMQSRLNLVLPADRPFDLRLDGQVQLPFWRRIYTLVPSNTTVRLFQPAPWHIGDFIGLLGALLGLNIAIILLTGLYLVPLASAVSGGTADGWVRRLARAWLGLLGVAAIVMTVLIVGGVPLVVVASLLMQVTPTIGSFVMALVLAAALWFFFTASFAYDAVVVSGINPLKAIMASLLVVRSSFWGAIGLFLVSAFIVQGLGIIWQSLNGTLVGVLFAMVASAYVGAGLTAAHLVFYRDRVPGRERSEPAR
jgi:hypothetical protein